MFKKFSLWIEASFRWHDGETWHESEPPNMEEDEQHDEVTL